jgi:hypothetical protein
VDLRFSQQWLWRVLSSEISPCCLVKANWSIRGTYSLHRLGWWVSKARNHHEVGTLCLLPASCWFLAWFIHAQISEVKTLCHESPNTCYWDNHLNSKVHHNKPSSKSQTHAEKEFRQKSTPCNSYMLDKHYGVSYNIIVTCMSVTINRVWTGDCTY